MKKVTYFVRYQIGTWIRENYITEYTEADDSSIKLRAMAMNWTLVKIEAGYK